MNNNHMTLVVPTIPKDFGNLLTNLDIYFSLLPISKICVIGNAELKTMMPKDNKLFFLEEENFVDFERLKKLIIQKTGNENVGKRTGWYVQQFVKLGFCRICEDEYYLLWDSDTVPVKKIQLFDQDGVPYLDCKTEFHKPYFDTICRLFPNYKKVIDGSFIAEHMLINVQLMRNMLDKIENNNTLDGQNFVEKIISAVDPINLQGSGFSEFETFGTFVTTEFPSTYKIREWHSLRFGGFYFPSTEMLDNDTFKWLAKKYDAVSFEKKDFLSKFRYLIPLLRKICPPSILDILSIPIRGVRKLTGRR